MEIDFTSLTNVMASPWFLVHYLSATQRCVRRSMNISGQLTVLFPADRFELLGIPQSATVRYRDRGQSNHGDGLAVMIPILIQANYPISRLRFLMLAFTLLLPPAVALARAKPWRSYAFIATVGVVSAIFGAWLVTSWPYSV